MQPVGFGFVLTTENVERLNTFYRDVVGLPAMPELGPFAHGLGGGVAMFIQGHSETMGMAKEPSRWLPGITVANLKEEQARLEAAGVSFIRREGREEWGGVISTFVDPDGNYINIMEWVG